MDPVAQPAAPEPKYYLATAQERSPAEGQKAKEVTFVVGAVDYKTAWQSARRLTAVGDAHFKGDAWADQDRKAKMEMAPAEFTIKSVDSLQQRSKKVDPVTVDAVLAEMQKQGKTVPKGVLDVIESLRAKGPITEPTAEHGDEDKTDEADEHGKRGAA
jgi:hypothetical protein